MNCPFEIDGICLAVLCLDDTPCNARRKDGSPNYEVYHAKPVDRKAKGGQGRA